MGQAAKKEREGFLGSFSCQDNVVCCKSGFKAACKVKDIGVEGFVECLEEKPQLCPFSISFGYSNWCKCPVGVHRAKELKG